MVGSLFLDKPMHMPSILMVIALHNGKISIGSDVKVIFFRGIFINRAYSMVEIVPH